MWLLQNGIQQRNQKGQEALERWPSLWSICRVHAQPPESSSQHMWESQARKCQPVDFSASRRQDTSDYLCPSAHTTHSHTYTHSVFVSTYLTFILFPLASPLSCYFICVWVNFFVCVFVCVFAWLFELLLILYGFNIHAFQSHLSLQVLESALCPGNLPQKSKTNLKEKQKDKQNQTKQTKKTLVMEIVSLRQFTLLSAYVSQCLIKTDLKDLDLTRLINPCL